jgi:hypothetical protein
MFEQFKAACLTDAERLSATVLHGTWVSLSAPSASSDFASVASFFASALERLEALSGKAFSWELLHWLSCTIEVSCV